MASIPDDPVAELTAVLSNLRLAVPVTLLVVLTIRWLSFAFLALMERIQSQGFTSLFGDDDDALWDDPPPDVTPTAEVGEAGEEPVEAIRPVVVREKRIRRALVLTLFGAVALGYFAEGVAEIVMTIVSNVFMPSLPLQANVAVYILGGLAAFALCGLGMALEEKWTGKSAGWGSMYPRVMAILGIGGELAVGLVLLRIVSLDPTSQPHATPFPLIQLLLIAFRLLLLILLVLSQTPLLYKSTFVPFVPPEESTESTSLLMGGPGRVYGTSERNGKAGDAPKKKSMLRPSKPISNRPPDPKSLSILTLFSRVKTLFPYLWPSKSITLQILALVCFGLMIAKRFFNVISPIYFGRVVQDLSEERSPYFNVVVYVTVAFLSDSNYFLQTYLWLPIEQYTEREMTMMSFDTLLNLSLAYHTRRKTGELLRILDRSEAINNFFETLIFTFLPVCIDLPVAVVVLWVRYGVQIVSIVMGISVLYVGASVALADSRTKLSRKLRDASQYMRQIQTDTLMNWETAKIFTAESFESSRLRDALRVYQKGYFRVYGMWNSLGLILNAISSFGLLVCSFILARRVTRGEMKVGNFVTFVSFLGGLYSPLSRISGLYRTVMSNLVDTEQLMDLLAEPRDIIDRDGATELIVPEGGGGGGIEFHDVHFAYDGKNETIKGISFKVLPGQSVALVGPSGGGKSTIMRLVYRFYDVGSGSITIDGHDIRDLTQKSLRGAIGLVPQDSVLFNETIRFNIAYGGGADVTEEQIVKATVSASMHDRILSFPNKYETRVGERGQRLSGGEKQRVAIARVLLKNPPILLLDEATSALDTTNERFIQARLRELSKGRTTLAIAHRLSTIVDSDVIFVLNDGVIAESGTHTELLSKGGLYAELWQKQIEGELGGAGVGTGPATPAGPSGTNTPSESE